MINFFLNTCESHNLALLGISKADANFSVISSYRGILKNHLYLVRHTVTFRR